MCEILQIVIAVRPMQASSPVGLCWLHDVGKCAQLLQSTEEIRADNIVYLGLDFGGNNPTTFHPTSPVASRLLALGVHELRRLYHMDKQNAESNDLCQVAV